MGVIRNSANRIIKGRVGDMTYYVSNGQQVARQALNNSNYGATAMRTDAQQNRRVKWSNLVNFYKLSKKWMKKAYESKEGKQSDYNKFMQLNVNTARVALTKTEAVQGACIIDAFQITQGTLAPIEVTKVGNQWRSSILLGNVTIDDNTTIGEFTANVVNNNPAITEGMQLSFVSYQQAVDTLGIARAICTFYEVTLNANSTAKLRDYLPAFCSQVLNGYLATNDNISLGGFSWIVSNQVNGKIFVSSQTLNVNNDALITQYSSAAQINAAVDSYGVTEEVVLSPISLNAQERVTPPLYISVISIDGTQYAANEYFGTLASLSAKAGSLTLSTSTDLTVTSIVAKGTSSGTQVTATGITKTGNNVTFTFGTSSSAQVLSEIVVTMSDGTELNVPFATTQGGGGEGGGGGF